MLDGELDQSNKKGEVNLPLAPDYINRPMQMVSEKGKPAKTIYEIIEVANGHTRMHFYPVTVSSLFVMVKALSVASLALTAAHLLMYT